jgi:hypothetical protein
MHTAGRDAQRAYEKYLFRILLLVMASAVFSLCSGIGIMFLFLDKNEETKERSQITREIIVSVGACLIEPPPKKNGDALRKCVNERLDDVDVVEKEKLNAPR